METGTPETETPEGFDQTTLAAWAANLKALFDQHLRDGEREREGQNAWLAFALEGARVNAQIVTRMAQDHATLSTRTANNALTLDGIILAGALTNPAELAETAIGSKVAEEVRSAAKTAMEAAVAATTQTSGVAQGAIQSATGIADAALLAQIAKLAEAVNALYLKVLGQEAVTK
jgi:hypothetical protein